MPIVGQFGSLARAGSFLLPGGAFESIATVTVGSGGASSIEFTSIPSTYQHLQVRLIGRTSRTSASIDSVKLQLNSDSGNNYAYHELWGTGSAASAAGVASQPFGSFGRLSTANATASIFGAMVIDILDYANTSKNTTVRSLGGVDLNGSGEIYLTSALWMSTAAVTSILLDQTTGPNFNQYTTAALYGLRAP